MYFLCVLYYSLSLSVYVSGAIAPILRNTAVMCGHRCAHSFGRLVYCSRYWPGQPHTLTLRLLMSYIYGAPSKATNFNVVYTGCNRRNVQNFGRVFLMLNNTDITQNTYIQS